MFLIALLVVTFVALVPSTEAISHYNDSVTSISNQLESSLSRIEIMVTTSVQDVNELATTIYDYIELNRIMLDHKIEAESSAGLVDGLKGANASVLNECTKFILKDVSLDAKIKSKNCYLAADRVIQSETRDLAKQVSMYPNTLKMLREEFKKCKDFPCGTTVLAKSYVVRTTFGQWLSGVSAPRLQKILGLYKDAKTCLQEAESMLGSIRGKVAQRVANCPK